jgi:PEP-CTERM motif-containing protein
MNLKIWLVVVAAAIAGIAAPQRASASAWFQFGPVEANQVVGLNYTVGSDTLLNGSFYAGQYLGTLANTQSQLTAGPNFTFQTFCVDLTHEVDNLQQYQVNFESLSNLSNGDKISYLYNQYGQTYFTPSTTMANFMLNSHNYSGVSTNDYAAALQVAIWDELANNGNTSGNLTVSGLDGTANSLVSDFLAVAQNASPPGDYLRDVEFDINQNLGAQAFVIPTDVPDIDTPEPASLTLAGLSLACFIPFGLRLRRRQAGVR